MSNVHVSLLLSFIYAFMCLINQVFASFFKSLHIHNQPHCLQSYHKNIFYRAMAVLEPLKVTIANPPTDMPSELSVADFPADESKGSHKVSAASELYIEQSDFREVCSLHLFV